jgi:nitroreductase
LAWITQDWLPNKRVQPTRARGGGFDEGGFSVGAAADAQSVGCLVELKNGNGVILKTVLNQKEDTMNDTLQTIHSLRTIHGDFSEQEISEADLDQILKACINAANASARQSFSIIVLDDQTRMRELFSYQGSQALIFCVDFTRIMAAARHLGHVFDNDDIIGFITGTIDTMLAVQTAVIAAKSLGIDSLITNGLNRNNLDKVYEILQLPETSCFPLITVVLGYPRQESPFKKGRLSSEFVVHFGQYHPQLKNSSHRL